MKHKENTIMAESNFERFIFNLEQLIIKYNLSIADTNRALAIIDIKNEARKKDIKFKLKSV